MIQELCLGIYLEKTIIRKDTCTPMHTLFAIAKTWQQPKCPSIEEWIQKLCIHTMQYSSAIKNNNDISSNMNGPRDYHTT